MALEQALELVLVSQFEGLELISTEETVSERDSAMLLGNEDADHPS